MTDQARSIVAIVQAAGSYPAEAPFHPDTRYPEYRVTGEDVGAQNHVYAAVREVLATLGFDREHYGQSDWNPLGGLIRSGDRVVVKPNLIRESRFSNDQEWEQVVTHASVVRAVVDYVAIALKGNGEILIADGPQTDSDFDLIVQRTGLDAVCEVVRRGGVDCRLLDLRRERWITKGDVLAERIPLQGDPEGYVEVALDGLSEFADYELSGHFYGADYDEAETASYHTGGRHRYVMCRSVMAADVIINLPKLKTHKKTGVTLDLKNMVGVNGLRNCLPHYTFGGPGERGDEFVRSTIAGRLQSRSVRLFKRMLVHSGSRGGAWARLARRGGQVVFRDTDTAVRSGNWCGNDTAWRMVLDVNKALNAFDAEGKPRRTPLRHFCLVDGIIGGDGDGPSDPDRVDSRILVAGLNPVAVDTVCAVVMGFDDRKLPVISRAWSTRGIPLVPFAQEEVRCVSNQDEWTGDLDSLRGARHLGFKAHFGWRGHIERGV